MRLLPIALGLALALAALPAMAQSSALPSESQSSANEVVPAVAAAALPVRELGQADAPVKIDLYMTFACAPCAEWYLNVLPELKRDYIDAGRVRLVFHDVVTEPSQPSVRSGMIGLCAAPGRFFDVAQSFASGLRAASEDVEMVDEWYGNAVAASGVPAEEMEACANSEPAYNQLRLQMQDPMIANLKLLPGVVVEGNLLESSSIGDLVAAVVLGPQTIAQPASD